MLLIWNYSWRKIKKMIKRILSKLTKRQILIIHLIVIIISGYFGIVQSPLMIGGIDPLVSGLFAGVIFAYYIFFMFKFINQKF